MTIGQHVHYCIDDFEDGKLESALLHACLAIDGSANKKHPQIKQNHQRYVQFLRENYWIIEPMMGGGINLEETIFPMAKLKKDLRQDLAEIIYVKYRCTHAHGDEHPVNFSFTDCVGKDYTELLFSKNMMLVPNNIIFALLGVAILSEVNSDQKSPDDYYLTLGDETFIINQWWGKENQFRPIAMKHNSVRVKLDFGDWNAQLTCP